MVCAQEMGVVVNPEGATMQMEGCITMGLGYALMEHIRFQGGEILDRNFNTYRIPRFSDLPEIETVLVENDELAPQGGGEPAIVRRDSPAMRAAFRAYADAFGREPIFIREGGSIPVVATLQKELGIETILMGFGLPDDNLHAPNEKIHLPNLYRGIETVIRFFHHLQA